MHIHAIIRADASGDELLPASVAVEELTRAVIGAVPKVAIGFPAHLDGDARFGEQLRVDPRHSENERDRRRVAGYVAKYETKSSDEIGALDRKIRSLEDLDQRNVDEHHRRLAETAWRLGGDPELESLNLRQFAHALGFRGHWLTKSLRWSTTFSALRGARAEYRREHLAHDSDPADQVAMSWRFLGSGWADAGEYLFIANQRENEDVGRSELREVFDTWPTNLRDEVSRQENWRRGEPAK